MVELNYNSSIDGSKETAFCFWSTSYHLLVTKTLSTHISKTGGPNSIFFLLYLGFCRE